MHEIILENCYRDILSAQKSRFNADWFLTLNLLLRNVATGSHEEGVRKVSAGTLGRAKIKTVKMTLVIISVFIFCWTPYNIMSIWLVHSNRYLVACATILPSNFNDYNLCNFLVWWWRFWCDRDSALQVDQRIQKGLFLFACANSCVNPMVYGFFSRRPTRNRPRSHHEFQRKVS